jgi:hypothetical protein
MDNALVGGCTEQKENSTGLWNRRPDQLCFILDLILNLNGSMLRTIYILMTLPLIACSVKTEEKEEVSAAQANEYPDISLTLENGQKVSAKQLEGNNVFVLFQPDCDHCQEEAIHIGQRLGEFGDYNLYFISSAPMEQITAFARNFDLDDKPRVKFAWTSTEGVLTYFGPIQTPSVYIYKQGKLKQGFNGQTEIDKILSAL